MIAKFHTLPTSFFYFFWKSLPLRTKAKNHPIKYYHTKQKKAHPHLKYLEQQIPILNLQWQYTPSSTVWRVLGT